MQLNKQFNKVSVKIKNRINKKVQNNTTIIIVKRQKLIKMLKLNKKTNKINIISKAVI